MSDFLQILTIILKVSAGSEVNKICGGKYGAEFRNQEGYAKKISGSGPVGRLFHFTNVQMLILKISCLLNS